MKGRLLNRREVEEITGFSCSSIYRKMREGSFPVPIKIGARSVRWQEQDIDRWLSSRPRATGDHPPPEEAPNSQSSILRDAVKQVVDGVLDHMPDDLDKCTPTLANLMLRRIP